MRHLELIDEVQIIEAQGKTRMPTRLRAIRAVEGFSKVQAIGVLRDADDNPQGAFESIRNALRDAALPYPARAGEIAQGVPATGVFIAPSASETGSLEDLCLQSLQHDKRMTCVRRFIQCVLKRQFSLHQLSKVQMMAFLAVQEREPCASLGIAAMRGAFDFTHPAFSSLKQFLQALVGKVQSA
ncbi:MAG: hypothetical protein NZM28_06165 [Fimbriimonadales bacterium]|nr:hypothetical protein [Fimbriimonadales bacterium]